MSTFNVIHYNHRLTLLLTLNEIYVIEAEETLKA